MASPSTDKLISESALAIKRCGMSYRAHQTNPAIRLQILEKRKYEITRSYQRLIAGLNREINGLRKSIHSEPSTGDQRSDSDDPQQTDLHPHTDTGAEESPYRGIPTPRRKISFTFITNDMSYKPEQKSIYQLKEEKREILNKIINGTYLDAVSMNQLTTALKQKEAQIKELIEQEKVG